MVILMLNSSNMGHRVAFGNEPRWGRAETRKNRDLGVWKIYQEVGNVNQKEHKEFPGKHEGHRSKGTGEGREGWLQDTHTK